MLSTGLRIYYAMLLVLSIVSCLGEVLGPRPSSFKIQLLVGKLSKGGQV